MQKKEIKNIFTNEESTSCVINDVYQQSGSTLYSLVEKTILEDAERKFG